MDLIEVMFLLSFVTFMASLLYQIYILLRQDFTNHSRMFVFDAVGFLSFVVNMVAMIYYSIAKETTFAVSMFYFPAFLVVAHFVVSVIYFIQAFTIEAKNEIDKLK